MKDQDLKQNLKAQERAAEEREELGLSLSDVLYHLLLCDIAIGICTDAADVVWMPDSPGTTAVEQIMETLGIGYDDDALEALKVHKIFLKFLSK